MKISFGRLWSEQDGAIVSAEIVLIMTIVVIGLISGLTSLRDAVVEELADVGAAIGAVSQTFSFGGTLGHCGSTSGSAFLDTFDFCDTIAGVGEVNSRCVIICFGATGAGAFSGIVAGTTEVGT